METSTRECHCLHCAAVLPASDLADGWCSACGKRLPSSVQATKKGPDGYAATLPAGDPPESAWDLNRVLCGGAIIALASMLAVVFLSNVF